MPSLEQQSAFCQPSRLRRVMSDQHTGKAAFADNLLHKAFDLRLGVIIQRPARRIRQGRLRRAIRRPDRPAVLLHVALARSAGSARPSQEKGMAAA
jgi:hypothetical protein